MRKKLFIFCLLGMSMVATSQVVTTLAGSGQGDAVGVGSQAQFYNPTGICLDGNGNLYVTDLMNYKVKKITPDGVVSTFAGSSNGYANGVGTAAQFHAMYGICSDPSGNLYLTESIKDRVRKINSAALVTTVSTIQGPYGIASDVSGNIFVTDAFNSRIVSMTPGGVVTPLAGSTAGDADGIGTNALFNSPSALCIDSDGNIYVSDTYNHKIKKIDANGYVQTIAGSTQGYADGDGSSAKFNKPVGICVDHSGRLYVADKGNNRIRIITPDGQVATLAGSSQGYADGTGTDASFNSPFGICIDNSGTLYITDLGNNVIRKITQTLGVSKKNISDFSINVYPNPATDVLNIEVNNFNSHTQISIVDMLGKKLFEQEMGDSAITVNTSKYPKGVYLLTVTDGTKLSTQKIVVK